MPQQCSRPSGFALQVGVTRTAALGKYADLIILDRPLATTPADQISATRVLRTVVGEPVVYDNRDL